MNVSRSSRTVSGLVVLSCTLAVHAVSAQAPQPGFQVQSGSPTQPGVVQSQAPANVPAQSAGNLAAAPGAPATAPASSDQNNSNDDNGGTHSNATRGGAVGLVVVLALRGYRLFRRFRRSQYA